MKPESQNEESRLDQLLQSAEWPAINDSSIQDLRDRWSSLLNEQEAVTPESIPTANRWDWKWISAVAASLIVGLLLWTAYGYHRSSRQADKPVPGPEASTTESAVDEESKPADSIVDQARDSDASRPDPAPATPPFKQDDYLNALARSRSRLQRGQSRPRIQSSFQTWLADRIGHSPLASAITTVVIYETDEAMSNLRDDRQISRRQWKAYVKSRRAWEQAAWKRTRKNGTNAIASYRIAICLATEDSLPQLEPLLAVEPLSNDAAVAIARLGGAPEIDRAIRVSAGERARRNLMMAMLNRPGSGPAMMFLEYFNEPHTRKLAIDIANSTDRLPANIWLETVASQDRARFDAALAVSHVCDQQVVQGLIQLATTPSTSRPAMMALLKSECADARKFVSYAETDYLLASQVRMARRKLAQLESSRPPMENQLHLPTFKP